MEVDSVTFTETLSLWGEWHQAAYALVALLYRRAVLTTKGQHLAGTLGKQLFWLPS